MKLKVDTTNLGDIYTNNVESFKLPSPIIEEEPIKEESEVLSTRRKKFQNTFNEIIGEYKK